MLHPSDTAFYFAQELLLCFPNHSMETDGDVSDDDKTDFLCREEDAAPHAIKESDRHGAHGEVKNTGIASGVLVEIDSRVVDESRSRSRSGSGSASSGRDGIVMSSSRPPAGARARISHGGDGVEREGGATAF